MHICAHEILILALLANAAQAGAHIYLFRAVTQARALAHKFKAELDARPIKTIIYGSKTNEDVSDGERGVPADTGRG